MLIDPLHKGCIAFVLVEEAGHLVPRATAFFIDVLLGNIGSVMLSAVYVVTAAHVIFAARRLQHMWLRVNTKEGFEDVYCDPYGDWLLDEERDVAIGRLPHPNSIDFGAIPHASFLLEGPARKWSVGPGDEIFALGLFSPLGKAVGPNRPLARVGKITDQFGKFPYSAGGGFCNSVHPAWKAELRSFGGYSGCPVFFRIVPNRIPGKYLVSRSTLLLGLIHGHIPERSDVSSVQFVGNTGVAVIVPADAIMNLINQDVVIKNRRELFQDIQSNPKAYLLQDLLQQTLRAAVYPSVV